MRQESMTSAPSQLHLLQVVFDRFHQTGEWPRIDYLRHELDLADDDLDVLAVGSILSPAYGRVDVGYEARASLTLHGIALTRGGEQELRDASETMRFAYRTFRDVGPTAEISSDILARELGLDSVRLTKTYKLVNWLPGIGGGGSTGPDSWHRQITADIIRFKKVESVEEFLAAVPHLGELNLSTTFEAPRSTTPPGSLSQPSVFISYAHEDGPVARQLAVGLKAHNFRVWIDEGEMRIGDSLIERIAGAIADGDFLLALVSKASVESSWCRRELSIAIAGGLRDAHVKVLPLRLGDVVLPPTLADVNCPRLDPQKVPEMTDRLAHEINSHWRDRHPVPSDQH